MDDTSKILDRIEAKMDKMQDNMGEMKEILARNTSDIEHHIKRTDLAEQNLELLREDLKPIKNHVSFVKGVMWALGIVGAFVMALHQLGILQKLF